jgi:UDP-N-acetyl-2-amino-2-deoxyglucuronate dehydrogenase
LREKIRQGPSNKIYDVDLTYVTSRGNWYQSSWKGDISKAGGIATNIGIHFFDMLIWIFGEVTDLTVNQLTSDMASGHLTLEKARVNWFLSINYDHLPDEVKQAKKRTFRTLALEGTEIEFSEGFTDLHTNSYSEILKGNAFGLTDAKPSIDLVYKIRNTTNPV